MAHQERNQERSIHEMLKDAPTMNENPSAIHTGTTNITLNKANTLRPNSLQIAKNHTTSNSSSPIISPSNGADSFLKNGSSKIDLIKNWSITT